MSPTPTRDRSTGRRSAAGQSPAAARAATTPVGSGERNSRPPAVTATTGSRSYRLPVVGAAVPAAVVETGFWGSLVACTAVGAVDPPLALLVGAGVLVARHRRG